MYKKNLYEYVNEKSVNVYLMSKGFFKSHGSISPS